MSIQFIDRDSWELRTEKVMGEGLINAAYGAGYLSGLIAPIVSTEVASKLIGLVNGADRPSSCKRIQPFVAEFGINMEDFEVPDGGFQNFQEFFTRALRDGARPIDDAVDSVIFPADARHLAFDDIEDYDGIYVKGQSFDLRSFVNDDELYEKYRGGSALFSRLCPVDYHRFHFPVAGVIQKNHVLVNGILWSVNTVALRQRLSYLWENRRWVTEVRSSEFWDMLMIEIGATNVWSARFRITEDVVRKGEEKGLFRLGGSFVVCVFQKNTMRFDSDIAQNTARQIETYAKMGQKCGVAISREK